MKRGQICLAAVLAGVLASPAPASAENLFGLLFGGPVRKRTAVDPVPPAPRAPAQTGRVVKAKPAKVTGPAYYDYKTDSLRTVSFVSLADAPRNVVFAPGQADDFSAALPGLDGYELAAEPDIAAALSVHYAAHPSFIWVKDQVVSPKAATALRVFSESAAFGLKPEDYSVSLPSAASADKSAEMIRFEMALSARALRYVRDVSSGRVDPNRISGYHDLPVRPINLAGVLASLAASPDLRAYLMSRHPQSAYYAALTAELEALTAQADDAIRVELKTVLKPGQSSPELPKILELIRRKADQAFLAEFGPVIALNGTNDVYGETLVPVIKAAQKAAGLSADGAIGPRTVQAFAGVSKADRIASVEIALEQLRWLPRDLGDRRVFINQASFMVSYFENNAEKLSMRVVVGKPQNQTSFFYDEIERVEFNPYWGVPNSILVNEMLPRLRRDPGYLDRAGYEVTDAKGKRIPSSAVNWGGYGTAIPYSVRQTPSEANALGELKILFPNKHAIYMHDTPSRSLFANDMRAYSHGCVRLEKPRDMAAAVLGWSVDDVAAKIKKGHSGVNVDRKIPVYLTYFTAWPDEAGKVGYSADIYERDARMLKAMERISASRSGQS